MKRAASLVATSPLLPIYRRAAADGVSLKLLQQQVVELLAKHAVTSQLELAQLQSHQEAFVRRTPLSVRLMAGAIPIISVGLGAVLLLNAVGPLAAYYVSPDVEDVETISPVPKSYVEQFFTQTAASESSTPTGPAMLEVDSTYTNLAAWFPTTAQFGSELEMVKKENTALQEYTLDIPKIQIDQAVVKIGGTDLNQSLIQYPGTADPGQQGAPVIFGHSVLRQFYNPSIKNSRRYISIFSKIMTLKPGDEIFVTRGGIKYTYIVEEKKEVKPEDVFILQQEFNQRRLKLVTCTPEGTYLRRGVVTAILKE